jgi:hypothetical protein
LTGCLTQGSGPTVFILENARVGDDMNATPASYLVVVENSSVNLSDQLNHEVRITGTREKKAQPAASAGQKPAEKDIPRLTAKSLTSVSDRCTTAGR